MNSTESVDPVTVLVVWPDNAWANGEHNLVQIHVEVAVTDDPLSLVNAKTAEAIDYITERYAGSEENGWLAYFDTESYSHGGAPNPWAVHLLNALGQPHIRRIDGPVVFCGPPDPITGTDGNVRPVVLQALALIYEMRVTATI